LLKGFLALTEATLEEVRLARFFPVFFVVFAMDR
jgi:hypothetical protein